MLNSPARRLLWLPLKPHQRTRATRRRLNLPNCCKLLEIRHTGPQAGPAPLIHFIHGRSPSLTSFIVGHDERHVASNFRGEAGAGSDLFTLHFGSPFASPTLSGNFGKICTASNAECARTIWGRTRPSSLFLSLPCQRMNALWTRCIGLGS